MKSTRTTISALALCIGGCSMPATAPTDPALPPAPQSVEVGTDGLVGAGARGGIRDGGDQGVLERPVFEDIGSGGIGPGLTGPDGILDPGSWEEGGFDREKEVEVGACSTNVVQFRDGETDRPRLTLDSFVFADDGDSIWVAGFETLGEDDACEWATSPDQSAGYQLIIELNGDRTDGTILTWMDDDTPDAAEIRLENGGAGTEAIAEDYSGSLELTALVPGQSLEVTAMTGALDDGLYITDGRFTACYCGSMVSE